MINYSECCGKYVATTSDFKSKNIFQTSKLVSNKDYHCSKCKQSTAENGNLRKNNRNDMKKFSMQYNVGSAKYLLNIHDGEKKHKDGSDFYDVQIFRNKKLFQKVQKELILQGYSLK